MIATSALSHTSGSQSTSSRHASPVGTAGKSVRSKYIGKLRLSLRSSWMRTSQPIPVALTDSATPRPTFAKAAVANGPSSGMPCEFGPTHFDSPSKMTHSARSRSTKRHQIANVPVMTVAIPVATPEATTAVPQLTDMGRSIPARCAAVSRMAVAA